MDRTVIGPFLIQGHRGARGLQPENTLPSFEAALDAGAHSLETDVRLTVDGVPVLIHDPIPSGGDRPVCVMSHAEVAAAGVPALADLYRLLAGRETIVDLDIKRQPFRDGLADGLMASVLT